MKALFERLFIHNWQRKAIAIVAALIIWILVNNSVTFTRTLTNIPVRVIDLPSDKTILGLLPNNYLTDPLTLTVTGTKSVIEDLNSSDLQVVIDARNKGDTWIVRVDKKSLESLNPDINIGNDFKEVSANEFIITLTPLITEKIPIIINNPTGEPPAGYQFLDVWPQHLYQTVSGPEQEVNELKSKGIEITFDLNEIRASELNLIESSKGSKQDEISFIVPESWKKVPIPFQDDRLTEINDPEAEHLRIDFLRKEFLPMDSPIPVTVFYPFKTSSTLNPDVFKLEARPPIKVDNGIYLLSTQMYVRDVSRLFLDVVRNRLEIVIIASPVEGKDTLPWSLQFIDPDYLEERYVRLANAEISDKRMKLQPQLRDNYLRNRFRKYMRQLKFYTSPDKTLQLDVRIKDKTIIVQKSFSPIGDGK